MTMNCVGGEPLVSVLVLSFNHAQYLRQALESIVNQRFDATFEVLVGDDASRDGSVAIASELAERFPGVVRLFAQPENLGMHGNHAYLLARARGQYIAYCEGDDYWLGPDKLQAQVDYMRAHPECGLVHGNYLNLIHMDGHWWTRRALRTAAQLRHRSGSIFNAMLAANRIQTCTVLCRRDLAAEYRRNGPGVDAYMVGDWPMFLYAAAVSEIGFIPRPLAAYRRTPGSMTNSGHQAAVERGLDAIRMAGDFCDYFRCGQDTREDALATLHRTLLWLAYQAADARRFALAWDWLEEHRPRLLASARVRAMRASIGLPWPRKAGLRALGMIEAGKHRLEFRRVDMESNQ